MLRIVFKVIIVTLVSLLLITNNRLIAEEHPHPTVHFKNSTNKLNLKDSIRILADPNHILTIDQLVKPEFNQTFKLASEVGNSFGFTKSVYWVSFSLHMDSMLNDIILLQFAYPLIDNLTLFVPNDHGGYGEKVTGESLAFSTREINHRTFLFHLPAHSGETRTYYLRLETEGSMVIPLTLWSSSALNGYIDGSNFVLGAYYGVMLLLFIAALTTYLKSRDKLFIYYAFYLLSYLLYQFSVNGFGYQYLWTEYTEYANKLTSIFISTAVIGALIFSGSFLQIRSDKHPHIKKIFNITIGFGIISVFCSLFANYAVAIQLSTITASLVPPVVLAGVISAFRQGYKPARYFLIAWCIFLIGLTASVLLHFGLIPYTFINFYSVQIGSILEILLLGYALLERFDTLRAAKEDAVIKASKYLNQLNFELEALVDARTNQLQEREAHLQALIDTLPDIVWLKDPNGIFLACNPKVGRLFGVPQSEIIGKTDFDFIQKELADKFRELDLQAINSKTLIFNEEELTYLDDGHTELLETVKSAVFTAEGKLLGVLNIGRDITDRKRSEKALLRSQKMEAIGLLTGGIAHDFNNILGIVQGNLFLLEQQLKGNIEAISRIDSINVSTQRAADLTRQLLGFSRRQSGQLIVTNINELIIDIEDLIARSVTSAIEVQHQFTDPLWLTAINPGDFQDALFNLILNARDAMPKGGRLILKTSNCTLDNEYCAVNANAIPGRYVQLAVIDNGEGIPEEQQEHIFEPFYTTKAPGKGTGLGLAMVFGFVERSNSHIEINSTPGIGTQFNLYLPRVVSDETPLTQDTKTSEVLPGGSETILVVDDEESLLTLASEFLGNLGYIVLTARGGKQALERLAAEPAINLLFSDIVMPGGINGYDLAKTITDKYPKIKVILTSGHTSSSNNHDPRVHFSSTLLSKPYGLSELAQRIRESLDD